MKKIWLFVIQILNLGLIYSCDGKMNESASINGYSLRINQLERIFYLNRQQPDANSIERFIRSKQHRWPAMIVDPNLDLTPERIARGVVRVADIFGIDRRILTALIWAESNFDPRAVSATGAVGITQLTSVGLLEYAHQLGVRCSGRLQVNPDSPTYFVPRMNQLIPGYELSSVTSVVGNTDKECYASGLKYGGELKEWLRGSASTQLTAGAVILKAKIAHSCAIHPSCTDATWTTETDANIAVRRQVITEGLELYNGDLARNPSTGRLVKQDYAIKILSVYGEFGPSS